MNVFTFIKNIIFTPRCVFCDCTMEPNTESAICSRCAGNLKICSCKPCCIKCGKPLAGYGKKQLCYFCINSRGKKFDRIVSVFEYEDIVRDSIVRYKTEHIVKYADTYAKCMASIFFEEYSDTEFDFMCSVPSHTEKRKNDEPDQVENICMALSEIIDLEFKRGMLKKTRKTSKQSYLSYKDRQNNVKNSIGAADDAACKGKTVLLIDDVCTTRATITECARALKEAGAKKVYALTLATTVKDK